MLSTSWMIKTKQRTGQALLQETRMPDDFLRTRNMSNQVDRRINKKLYFVELKYIDKEIRERE